MGIDASRTEATGLDRQQHAASSDGTGRHAAEETCMRGEMDGPDRPMCHRPWMPSARTGARLRCPGPARKPARLSCAPA